MTDNTQEREVWESILEASRATVFPESAFEVAQRYISTLEYDLARFRIMYREGVTPGDIIDENTELRAALTEASEKLEAVKDAVAEIVRDSENFYQVGGSCAWQRDAMIDELRRRGEHELGQSLCEDARQRWNEFSAGTKSQFDAEREITGYLPKIEQALAALELALSGPTVALIEGEK